MTNRWRSFFWGIVVAAWTLGGAQAQETPTAEEDRTLEEVLRDEPGLRPETKRALEAMEHRVSETESLLSHFDFNGDFRVREEYSFRQDGFPDRNRLRVRLRFGFLAHVTDELDIGVRIRSGNPQDPNSPHATLGDGFDSIDLNIDRAYLSYRPRWADAFVAEVGKFANPFRTNPVYGELVWDADLQPEGATLRYGKDGDGFLRRFDAVIGQYFLLETARSSDSTITVGQVSTQLAAGDDSSIDLIAGYYQYNDLTPGGSQDLIIDNVGNALIGFDLDGDGMADLFDFRSHFGILDVIAAYSTRIEEWPFILSGELISNVRNHGGRGLGWAFGATLGSWNRRGEWRFDYQYQLIEQESVFSDFADDDTLLSTNHRSHVLGVNYMIADTIGLRLWSLASQRLHNVGAQRDHYQWRIRLDLNIAF